MWLRIIEKSSGSTPDHDRSVDRRQREVNATVQEMHALLTINKMAQQTFCITGSLVTWTYYMHGTFEA